MEEWKHGGVDQCGYVSYDSARYCADYIGKSYLGKGARAVYFPRLPPFQVMSQGIGRKYVDENAQQLRENLGVTVHGVHVGLPRYYATRLKLSEEDWLEAERVVAAPSRKTYGVGCAPDEVAPAREQREKDYLARLHMFRKGKL